MGNEKAEMYRAYLKASVIGIEVALSIAIGAGGGYLCDRYFQSEPWGMLIGFLIGVAAAGKRLYLFSKDYLKEQ